MRSFFLNSYDSTPLFVRQWDKVALSKGLVLVCHDLGEHSGRYSELAKFLESKNIMVIAYDQRCFGASSRPEALGQGCESTFDDTVQDLIFVFRYFQREHAGCPIVVMGHGYGAYVALSAMQKGSIKPKAVILSGIGMVSTTRVRLEQSIVAGLPKKDKASLAYKQIQGLWSTKVGGKDIDYLTSDEERLATYRNDPLCNIVPSVALELSMLQGLLIIFKEESLSAMDRGVPYALFVGMSDPTLGKDAQDALELLLTLRKRHFVTRFFGYEGARHSIWQEKTRKRYLGHLNNYLTSILS